MKMTKQDVVNNGWLTDVAIASDNKITLDNELFKAHITHPSVYDLLYSKPDFTSETIVLNSDYVTDTVISLEGTHTLDLNGHTIKNDTEIYDKDKKIWSLLSVGKGSDVTIEGNGGFIAKENDCYAIDVKGGKLTIKGGEFNGNISAVYVYEGEAVIEGGVFRIQQLSNVGPQNGCAYILNCLDSNYKNGTAKITVYGGEFHGFDPTANPEGKNTTYVAEGYESVEITPNIWRVQRKAEVVNEPEVVDEVDPVVDGPEVINEVDPVEPEA
jgi:hypothetical protein